jgi:RNA polymerase sigma factor (sigma-70 family)
MLQETPIRGHTPEETVGTDWSDLYRSTFSDLVRFLHRKVWDVERARDLAQECFVRALRDEPERPRAWLFAVAANLARDEARTVIRRRKHLTLLKAEASGRRAPDDPARELAERERQERVKEALEALGERDREVLLLWDAGLNYSEISEETGLAPGAVGTTLARARRRLVDAFEAMEKDHAARH